MNLEQWIGCSGPARAQLLQDARRVARRLAAPRPGSMVALAFGQDRRAFAVSLVACWLRGHGAAVVENTLRERIMAVLAHASVVDLLHDTDSGRPLQVPRLLAAPETCADDAALEPASALPTPMLAVHVQTEDGDQEWCSWTPDELTAAVDATQRAEVQRLDASATPGLLASLFVDTLAPLRTGLPLDPDARRTAPLPVPGAPAVASRHAEWIAAALARDGVEDAAVVHDRDDRPLRAVSGAGAAVAAAQTEGARALPTIPRDPNGQPLRSELCLLFGLGRSGQPVTRELRWTPLAGSADEATWRTELPRDYVFYEGHFDGYPVLAGGVQLHELVLPQLRASAGALPALQQLDGVKFLARFTPGETIDLTLKRSAEGDKVTFEIRRGETRCTTGRLHFAASVPTLEGSART